MPKLMRDRRHLPKKTIKNNKDEDRGGGAHDELYTRQESRVSDHAHFER
jgi:hypothetical protein